MHFEYVKEKQIVRKIIQHLSMEKVKLIAVQWPFIRTEKKVINKLEMQKKGRVKGIDL